MTLQDIPQDVARAAQAAWADTKVISAALVSEHEDSDVLPYVIGRTADAILAERERCAKIAAALDSGVDDIAAAIRGEA